MVRPEASNSTSVPSSTVVPARTLVDSPRAGAIWEASVRAHTSWYTSCWSRSRTSATTSSGVRQRSPAGRIASCASWALATLPVYCMGREDR